MAKIYPTIENIERLKVKPTDGERFLIDYLIKKFNDDVEIFFQPFLNGDRPDIILLKKGVGATIIEVKDWDLKNYKIDESNQWHLISNNQKIKSPFQQVYHYKDNMFNLHINGMLEEKIKNLKFYGRINVYVYFHNATKKDLVNLYENLNLNQSKLEKINRDIQYTAITRDNIKIYLPKNDDLGLFKDSIYDEFKRILQQKY